MKMQLFFSFVFFLLLTGCDSKSYFLSSGPIMGTSYNVKLVVDGSLAKDERKALDSEIKSRLNFVNDEFSTYLPTSQLMQFNASEIGGEVVFSDPGFELLARAHKLKEWTNGYFDPSIGPLVRAWGFGAEAAEDIPDSERIVQLLEQSGMRNLELIPARKALRKTGEIFLDLSAIAKGYSVDLVAQVLRDRGYKNFMVEVGGEIFVSGNNIEGNPWRLGIEAPDFAGRRAYTITSLSNAAMATSGDYRNFIDGPSGRYSHTINPRNGYPVEADIASVTVVHEACADADALATALMAMGKSLALEFAESNNLAAYFIFRGESGLVSANSPAFEQYLGKP